MRKLLKNPEYREKYPLLLKYATIAKSLGVGYGVVKEVMEKTTHIISERHNFPRWLPEEVHPNKELVIKICEKAEKCKLKINQHLIRKLHMDEKMNPYRQGAVFYLEGTPADPAIMASDFQRLIQGYS